LQFVGAVLISVHVEAMLGACYYHYKCGQKLHHLWRASTLPCLYCTPQERPQAANACTWCLPAHLTISTAIL